MKLAAIEFCCNYFFQQNVKVMQMWSDEIEMDSAGPGENLKIKVSGVEEEVSTFSIRNFMKLVSNR